MLVREEKGVLKVPIPSKVMLYLSDFKSFKELVYSLSNCWWTKVAKITDLWHAGNKVLAYKKISTRMLALRHY